MQCVHMGTSTSTCIHIHMHAGSSLQAVHLHAGPYDPALVQASLAAMAAAPINPLSLFQAVQSNRCKDTTVSVHLKPGPA